jgi:heme-degrading monooxygenase HmoA
VQLAEGQLTSTRYIASNRFKVRPNAGAKFEKRWAERTSR